MTTNTQPFELRTDSWGRWQLIDGDGATHEDVAPVRLFPITDPDRFIAILDARQRPLALVPDLQSLPEEMRNLLREALAGREFLPVIQKIHHISSHVEPCEFDVDTDRGRTQFVLKSDDDVHRLGPHRAMLIDAQGVRYLINDTRTLDSASRRLVERYV